MKQLLTVTTIYLLIALFSFSCNNTESCEPKDWYQDLDGDGYGNINEVKSECEQPEGFIANSQDCDDENEDVYPGAPELCDNEDNDCNTIVDDNATCPTGKTCETGMCKDIITWYADTDGDGFGDPTVSQTATTQPANYVEDNSDCNDNDDSVYPGAPELCDNKDNNCDGQPDEENDCLANQECVDGTCVDLVTWYQDVDGDGFGNQSVTTLSAVAPEGYVDNNSDCNDNNSEVYPGAVELCDGIDNNCDAEVDNGTNCPAGSHCDGVNGCVPD